MDTRPNLQDDGWELESALAKHRRRPVSFHIPGYEERANLQVGDRVKLLFLLSGQDEAGSYIQGERMWVTVKEVNGTNYVGTLESRPMTSDVLKPGDRISFGPDHVAGILLPVTDPRHPNHQRR